MGAHRVRSGRRGVALLLAAALTPLVVLGLARPAGAEVRDINDFACPPGIESPFTDIGADTHRAAIECLAEWGITQGTTPTTYSPGREVSRGQMASFLVRALQHEVGLGLDPSDQGFTDVAGHTHEASINALASVGIARGKTATTFAPDEPVSRGQLATFLFRAYEVAARVPLPPGPDAFTDDGPPHEASINAIAAVGVVQGVGGGRYAPLAPVGRGAMASFVVRFLDFAVEDGAVTPLFITDIGIGALEAGQEVGPDPARIRDEGATGAADLYTIGIDGVLCWEIVVFDLSSPAVAAHIHEGPRGEAGPIVVTLEPPDPDRGPVTAHDYARGCTVVEPALLADIAAEPESYYVNVHTEDDPDGAVRGQLGRFLAFIGTELSGEAEVPGPGHPDAGGFFGLAVTSQPDQLCYFIEMAGFADATAAHIHRGGEGDAGPPVVTLRPPGPDGLMFHCVTGVDQALVQEIADDPTAFYVNVHNPAYPDGAIRGQLFRFRLLTTELSGAAEVPGPGDPDGAGEAHLFIPDATTVCAFLSVEGIGDPVAAHIHEGAVGVAGPPVITLDHEALDEESCVSGLDPALVEDLGDNPAGYYVNVHTAAYPDGAIRGQLQEQTF